MLWLLSEEQSSTRWQLSAGSYQMTAMPDQTNSAHSWRHSAVGDAEMPTDARCLCNDKSRSSKTEVLVDPQISAGPEEQEARSLSRRRDAPSSRERQCAVLARLPAQTAPASGETAASDAEQKLEQDRGLLPVLERFGQSASRWSPGSAALLLAFQTGSDPSVREVA